MRPIIALIAAALLLAGFLAPEPQFQSPTLSDSLRRLIASGRGEACLAGGADPALVAEIERLSRNLPPGVEAFEIGPGGRWGDTANGPSGVNGTPVVLTYSFVPDGNFLLLDEIENNKLHATLNAAFGNESAWKQIFRDCFDEWSRFTGIVFIEETADDGAPMPDADGQIGVRGDIRIAAIDIDGPSNILAFNFFPTFGGDQVLDAAESWGAPAQAHRFMRNIVMHELGHGIGLGHVIPVEQTKLMEPFLSTAFVGPQDDDVRGGIFMYGDRRESDDTAETATVLSAFSNGQTVVEAALHDGDDVDWYWLPVSAGVKVAVSARPIGSTYQVGPQGGSASTINTRNQLPLSLELRAANGVLVLDSASAAIGQSAVAAATRASGDAGFFVRVSAGAAGAPQRYELLFEAVPPDLLSLNVTTFAGDGATVSVSPADAFGRTSLTMPAVLYYPVNSSVTLTAPNSFGGNPFDRWIVNGASQPTGQQAVTFNVSEEMVVSAVYGQSLNVSVAGNLQLVSGEVALLTAVATGGQFPYTYSWTPTGTLTDPTQASVTASPAQTTTYTVEVADRDGKSGVAAATVTVSPALSANAGEDQFVKLGDQATLTASASGGTQPYKFHWSPTISPGNATSATYRPRIDRDRTFTLTVTDNKGRTATDSVRVTAVDVLTVGIGDEIWMQLGESRTIQADITGGAPPYTLRWFAGGRQLAETGDALKIQPEADTGYLLIATDALGFEASDNLIVHVVPPLQVVIEASSTTPTAGQDVRLRARPTGGRPPYQFEWTSSTGAFGSDGSQITVRVNEATTFRLRVTDLAGFEVRDSVRIRPQVATASAPPAPVQSDPPPADPPRALAPPCGLFGFQTLLLLAALLPCCAGSRRRM